MKFKLKILASPLLHAKSLQSDEVLNDQTLYTNISSTLPWIFLKLTQYENQTCVLKSRCTARIKTGNITRGNRYGHKKRRDIVFKCKSNKKCHKMRQRQFYFLLRVRLLIKLYASSAIDTGNDLIFFISGRIQNGG